MLGVGNLRKVNASEFGSETVGGARLWVPV